MNAGTEVVTNRNIEDNINKALLGIIGIVFLIGLGFWIKQLTSGFTGYSEQYAWGLYIAAFFTAVAGGAGAMILGSVTIAMQTIKEETSKQYYLAAIAMFVMAGFFIMADLGAPLNIFKLIFTSNIKAPMIADFWLLIACVIICAFMVFGRGQKKNVAILGLLCAFALLLVESWLVSSSSTQLLWGITMGAGTAFIQVAIMALALLLLIGEKAKYVKVALVLSLIIFLAVSLTDLIVGLSDGGRLGLQWAVLAKSGLFWIGIILGTIIPLLILITSMKVDKSFSIIIPISAMIGVLLTKLSYVWSSQAVPAIESKELLSASLHFEEVIVVLGFIALGTLVYYGLNSCKGGSSL